MHNSPFDGLRSGRRQWLLIFTGPVLLLALASSNCGGGKQPEPVRETAGKGAAEPKILQFYASPPVVSPGERVLLCYGVEEAEAVRIEPEVEPLKPSYSRCIPVTPRATTRYTLTAEGAGGGSVTSSVTVTVQGAGRAPARQLPAAAPSRDAGPVIDSFHVEKKEGPGGALTLLCYEVHEAEAVAIEPGVLPRSGALRGCLGVAPEQPTTYFLTAYGPGGKTARRAITAGP